MSRIPTPATISDAPEKSRPLLEAVQKQLGVVPNLFRLVATSPQALEGYLGLSGALGKGALPVATRERIALARVPGAFAGAPISLITASMLALAFMGFAGLIK